MNFKSMAKLWTREVDPSEAPDLLPRRTRGDGRVRTPRVFVAMLAGVAASVAGSPAGVADTSPAMTSSPPPAGIVGNSYVHLFQAQLDSPVFRVTVGSLPPGITLQPEGFLTGAPTGAGSFGPTTVCGANDVAPPACQTFTIGVYKRRLAILASPSQGGAVGTPVRETASLVGALMPTGSVTFRLFSDPACTAEVFRSTNAVSLEASTSNDFTPAAPGTYQWTTSYSGDANNEPASTPCDTSNSVAITTSSTTTTAPPATTTTTSTSTTTTVPSTTTTTSVPVASPSGRYHPLVPARILDTRSGAPVGAGGTVAQTVVGVGGVPATGVSAVALNVTVTGPTASSFLTVYPSGAARPATSNLNFVANQTVPNMVIAKVGADGKVAAYNGAGSVHVIFDVVGWFGSDATPGGDYNAVLPARILDTRSGAPVGAGGTVTQTVVGVGGVPATGVSAVALNVTVTGPTAPGFLTVYPSGAARPATSNLNFVANQTVPNMVIAKVGADGKVAAYNEAGSVHVIFDVVGWFGSDATSGGGGAYNAVLPARILDTRSGAPVGADGTITQAVAGVGGVPATGVSAVVLNVAVTGPTAPSFLTLYPSGAARPATSNLNFVANQTVSNMVIAKVGADGRVAVYNMAGSTHVIFDVVGWYSA